MDGGAPRLSQVSPEVELSLGNLWRQRSIPAKRMIADTEVTGFVECVLRTLSRDESLRLS